MPNLFKINRLNSGGLITNYFCTSKCGHCLYNCSPGRGKDYIDRQFTVKVMQKIKSMGCHAIHIGGGEPMLNVPKLIEVAGAARETGMAIEYVETNSSWYTTDEKAMKILKDLLTNGISCLLVSISPFHNEHIPFYKVKGVLNACRRTGMQVFPWVMDFYSNIDAFDDRVTHGLEGYAENMEAVIWNGYHQDIGHILEGGPSKPIKTCLH
jgi:uncharacterized Fe-S cluster-containing radical SAM superfamily protein